MNSITLDPELDKLFKDFANGVEKILEDNLKSLIIYGSVSLEDFRKGKGDIDFVCITQRDLSDKEIEEILDLHDNIRNGSLGELGIQLEGGYYTLAMMKDIKANQGRGYYIGTSRKGWKEAASASSLNYIDIEVIAKHGVVISGEENKGYLNLPTKSQIRKEFISKLENYIDLSKGIKDIWFSIEAIYFAVRGLNTLLTGALLSKGQACGWFCEQYPTHRWKTLVEYTSQFRYPLTREEESEMDKSFIINNSPLLLQDILGELLEKKLIKRGKGLWRIISGQKIFKVS